VLFIDIEIIRQVCRFFKPLSTLNPVAMYYIDHDCYHDITLENRF